MKKGNDQKQNAEKRKNRMTALLMALILCVGMVSGTNKEVRAQSASQNSETQTAQMCIRDRVKGASGYEIYCKTGKGKWKLVKTLNKGSKASYKLKGKAGKKYTYKVRVFQKVENKVIYGQYSNTKSAKIKK